LGFSYNSLLFIKTKVDKKKQKSMNITKNISMILRSINFENFVPFQLALTIGNEEV